MDLNIQYRKASKYIATVELEFKGEQLDYVKLLMKDSFLAGIKEVQTLPIDSVSDCNMQDFMEHYQNSKHTFTDKAIDVLKSYKR